MNETLLSSKVNARFETGPPVLQICIAQVTGTLGAQQGRGEQVVLTGWAEMKDFVNVRLGGGGGVMIVNGIVWLKYSRAQEAAPNPPSPAAASTDTTGTNCPVAGLMICLLHI
jgi:hypothetical protein